ncbi:PREDICTED: heat shock factor-binding protein 1-like protein 1 [Pygoscelis adeliae]|uniref:heat shock factor-binding protein 1-like protein 1 n=1 Tax=Pygoscelis adeliae TaxID=9238 RepID=UPI0004F5013A|nr:PREDICTED: heat shock factor-binding protein 1-like protein 1 [Pygoscelis adeliae]
MRYLEESHTRLWDLNTWGQITVLVLQRLPCLALTAEAGRALPVTHCIFFKKAPPCTYDTQLIFNFLLEEMGERIDDLEKHVADLMTEAGIENTDEELREPKNATGFLKEKLELDASVPPSATYKGTEMKM